MKPINTIEDAKALVGQTFGQGNNARTIDRIENIRTSNWHDVVGTVYWKRPGGKVRSVGQGLPYFLSWARKAEREGKKTPITRISDVENVTSQVPEDTVIEGYIERDGNKVTIVYEVCV